VAIVAGFYSIWLTHHLPRHHPERLADIGGYFLARGQGNSDEIDRLRGVAHPGLGYDGQFFVFMAFDLRHAPAYLDKQHYRMNRVGFPATATAVSAGRQSVIPWTMLGIELLAVLATTALLAVMVVARGGSAFLALVYGLSPGLLVAASRLLSEAPANALALLGAFVFTRRRDDPWPRSGRIMGAGCAFAAAALFRETTLLFPLGLAVWMLAMRSEPAWARARSAALLVAVSATPIACWQAFLLWWLPPEPVPDAVRLSVIPFGGLISHGMTARTFGQLVVIVVPSCLAVLITAVATRWSIWTPIIALNALVLVVFLPRPSYDDLFASARISLSIILVFVLVIPATRGRLRIYGATAVSILWMLPWLYFFPRNVL
jgi:hypothetical protein